MIGSQPWHKKTIFFFLMVLVGKKVLLRWSLAFLKFLYLSLGF